MARVARDDEGREMEGTTNEAVAEAPALPAALADLLKQPTDAQPGTPEKLAVMERRADFRLPLFIPGDRPIDLK